MTAAPVVAQFKSNLGYARAYAKLGWRVFPLHEVLDDGRCSCSDPNCSARKGKHPRIPNGFKRATTDEAQIRQWWSRWPNAPIGVATGVESGIVVIDVDLDKGGAESWQRLCQEHGPAFTVRAKTGRDGGGIHYYYRSPGTTLKSTQGLFPGIDVRADGGYVVAPPSKHASGRRYEFAQGAGPNKLDLEPCPEWLIAALTSQPKPKRQPIPGAATTATGWLYVAFDTAGMIRRELEPGKWAVVCPFEAEHSGKGCKTDSSTVIFAPDATCTLGHFHCSHAHCHGRTIDDVRKALPGDAVAAANRVFPPLMPDDPTVREAAFCPEPPTDTPEPPEGFFDDDETDSQDDVPIVTDSRVAVAPVPSNAWVAQLDKNPKTGEVLSNISNALHILTNDPTWTGVIEWNEFTGKHTYRKPAPWDSDCTPSETQATLCEEDGTRLHVWLYRHWNVKLGPETCLTVLKTRAEQSKYHPVRDWLNSLHWDGVDRLSFWGIDYLGAEDTQYHRAICLRWMIGAVARIMQPGCQMDNVLVLEGAQGLRKTRALQTLFSDDWYACGTFDMHNARQAGEFLQGKWGVELGELASVGRADQETTKNFITIRVDHYQRPYGRDVVDRARQCVFAGTTNQHQYGQDETGSRRFWGLKVGTERFDIDALAAAREQLWAEAVARYKAGEQWWLTDEEEPDQVAEQEKRRELDPWEDIIAAWIDNAHGDITVARILEQAVERRKCDQTVADQRRVGRVLRVLGYEQTATRGARGCRVKVWGKVKP